MLKREVSRVHTRGLSLRARQLAQKHLSSPTRKSVRWQPVRSRGDAERIPETNGFSNYWEHPPNPVPGPESRGPAPPSLPSGASWRQLGWGKPRPGASYRESAASPGRQSLVLKVDPSSKGNKEARLVEKKVRFISKAGNQRGVADSCPKPDFLHWQPVGRGSFRPRQEKGSTRKQQSHLGIGHTRVIFIVLSIANLQFQVSLFHWFEFPSLGTVAPCVIATVWSSCD